MEPGEVAKLWEVCRRIKNASLRELKSQELEFAASNMLVEPWILAIQVMEEISETFG